MNEVDKNVLLISNGFYAKEMVDAYKKNNINCYFIKDKPSDSFFNKFLGRIQFRPYLRLTLSKYYFDELKKLEDVNFDYILCIRGEYTPKEVLAYLTKKHYRSKKILYMWDSVQNNRHITEKWEYFDSVITFDRKDYIQNNNILKFLPLFYCESKIPKNKSVDQYDISFIGTAHQDRVKIVKQIKKQCDDLGLSFYAYCYSPHFLAFLYNKVFNKNYRGVGIRDVSFDSLSLNDVYSIYSKSNVILDIESPKQTGLTMRTIENVGTKKKLMTSNYDIVNYDFYDSNNILVFDRNEPKIDMGFIKSQYKDVPEEIYEKYSLSQWIVNVLSI